MRVRIFQTVLILCLFSLGAFAGEQEDLYKACKQSDLAGVKVAVKAGADVKALDQSGNNALASAFFSAEVTKYLLEKGCDPNNAKYPALISACNTYSMEVAEMLIKAGADPNQKGIIDPSDIYRALVAAEKKKDEPNEAMIDAWSGLIGKAPTSETSAINVTVMQTNNVSALKLLIDNGANMDVGEGTTVFHLLANYSNSPESRKKLFAQGAPMMANFGYKVPDWYSNLPDKHNGASAEMLDLLAGKGVEDINKPDVQGFTPLVIALKGLNPPEGEKETKLSIAKGLIKYGADPMLAAEWDFAGSEATYYPICTAAEYGDLELIKMMLEKGAGINSVTGTSTLSYVAKEAVSAGTWGGKGYTPLIIAAMFKNLDVASYLVDQGADLVIGSEGYAFVYFSHEDLDAPFRCLAEVEDKTPIYWALETGDLGLVKKIADKIKDTSYPEFSFEVIGGTSPDNIEGGEDDYLYSCPRGDDFEMTPSEYAQRAGFQGAAEYCAGLGM